MRYWAPKIKYISHLKPQNSKDGRTGVKGDELVPKAYIYVSNLKPQNSKDGRTGLKGEALVPKAYTYIYQT